MFVLCQLLLPKAKRKKQATDAAVSRSEKDAIILASGIYNVELLALYCYSILYITLIFYFCNFASSLLIVLQTTLNLNH
ncbi:MAG: hypothetical protein EAZ67_11715 [Cytophagales bacterium]|nr:MAG: hypothetical protein EAZ67_11715 [Cytophagales bacterium]